MTILQDPLNGNTARVDSDNRLQVASVSESIQHSTSHDKGQAYQVQGTATLASGTVVGLQFENTSSDKDMVISYVRSQIIDAAGGTVLPSVENYLLMQFGRTYASGGAQVTPVNMNTGSGNQAEATIYNGGATLAGTGVEFDREYWKAEAELVRFNKEGAMIVGPNDTFDISFVGDHTSGTGYVRVSFMMVERSTTGSGS
ncbi:MAG: hypothetical protein KAS66_05245 [Candidatus Omnitrophica bacterium]|nr:hypothetical protein [Candidatus Omnitrophota bacterium]